MSTKHTNTLHDTYLPAVVFQVTSYEIIYSKSFSSQLYLQNLVKFTKQQGKTVPSQFKRHFYVISKTMAERIVSLKRCSFP